MESIYIPDISQYKPGIVEGGALFTRDCCSFDLRVSLVTVHPASKEEIGRFDGYSATVLLHPKTDLKHFAHLSPKERDDFRKKSHEYAGICASLAMMPWDNTDIVLVVDHAGELISRFVNTMREIKAVESKREKRANPDGTTSVTKVLLPSEVDFAGKNVYILDEFIGSGYTLKIIIDEVYKAGGRVNGIGVIATIFPSVEFLNKDPYNVIPIRTLMKHIEE